MSIKLWKHDEMTCVYLIIDGVQHLIDIETWEQKPYLGKKCHPGDLVNFAIQIKASALDLLMVGKSALRHHGFLTHVNGVSFLDRNRENIRALLDQEEYTYLFKFNAPTLEDAHLIAESCMDHAAMAQYEAEKKEKQSI